MKMAIFSYLAKVRERARAYLAKVRARALARFCEVSGAHPSNGAGRCRQCETSAGSVMPSATRKRWKRPAHAPPRVLPRLAVAASAPPLPLPPFPYSCAAHTLPRAGVIVGAAALREIYQAAAAPALYLRVAQKKRLKKHKRVCVGLVRVHALHSS